MPLSKFIVIKLIIVFFKICMEDIAGISKCKCLPPRLIQHALSFHRAAEIVQF
jgi:hypothetical protein